MSSFHDLPIEIILEIVKFSTLINATGDRIGKDDLCKLRLVSKHFNTLVCPVLFAELHLDFDDTDNDEPTALDYSRCHEIIVALATPSTTVFEHTKKLHMCTQKLYWTEDHHRDGIAETKKLVTDKIFHAISALKNLRTIVYFCNPKYDPDQLVTEVIRGLATLPSFEGFDDLHFLANPPPSFTLKPISNLTTFRTFWSWDKPNNLIPEITSLLARCPDLTELYLGGGPSSTNQNATLREIFSEVEKMEKVLKLRKLEMHGVLVTPDDIQANIRHFEHLTYLGITSNPSPGASTTFGQICNIFQRNAILLKGISTDNAGDPLLLSYLSSYSGLTDLHLGAQDGFEDSEIVDQVYTRVLPSHFETLEDLRLGSQRSFAWCSLPSDKQFAELLKCQKLRILEVNSIANLSALEHGDGTTFEKWYEVGLQLPNLMHLMIRPRLEASSLRKIMMTWSKVRGEVTRRYRTERGMKFRVNND